MKKLYVTLLIVLAILAALVGVVYFMKTATNLPHFFPGYTAGLAGKHTKHGIAFFVLAVVLLLVAWMVGGTRKSGGSGTTTGTTTNTPQV